MVVAYEYSGPSGTRRQDLWVRTTTSRLLHMMKLREEPHEHTNRALHAQS